jgi:plastocyanin
MHPTGVASAAWVIAAAPSKAPFYVAGGLLACWAVALALGGITRPGFPGSDRGARAVMGVTAVLVLTTLAMAVVTGSTETPEKRAQASTPRAGGGGVASPALKLAADPSGKLAFDRKQATAGAGKVTVDFTNRSPVPHNLTIARGTKVLAATKTITASTATATANLPRGTYVYFCSVDAHRQGGMQGTLTVR